MQKNSVDCVRALIEMGAKPNIANRWNMSFILCAICSSARNVVEYGFEHYRGLVSSVDWKGRGILHYLADLDDHDVAVDIIKNTTLLSVRHQKSNREQISLID